MNKKIKEMTIVYGLNLLDSAPLVSDAPMISNQIEVRKPMVKNRDSSKKL